eukprot:104473-Chlamydomonas_euryale.AAC.1
MSLILGSHTNCCSEPASSTASLSVPPLPDADAAAAAASSASSESSSSSGPPPRPPDPAVSAALPASARNGTMSSVSYRRT